MAVLEQLEPYSVFHFFEEICAIPHGSGNLTAMSNYLAEFAGQRGLEYYQDDTLNVIIIKEASEGYEDAPPIILQGHMDMVAVKKPDCSLDMKTQGLRPAVDGDDIYAEGTSLGGDDGIAVAYALALLDAKDIPHPRLEVVITTEEETGMDGARAIDLSMLRGNMMLNLDSEEEGILLTSCAGGATVDCELAVQCADIQGSVYSLSIRGLQGGHSGAEIHMERGNSNVLTGRLFYRLQAAGVSVGVSDLSGGLANNAIPQETRAEVVVPKAQESAFEEQVRAYEQILKKELAVKDAGVEIVLTKQERERVQAAFGEDLKKIAALLYTQPNGVQSMSANIHGLVQTSLNLGILRMEKGIVLAEYALRSSVASECDMLVERLKLSCDMIGASAKLTGSYPAWEFRQDSALRERMVKVYRRMYGSEPKIEAIHAGLECGILSAKIADLDCVSIGPDMKHIHTAEETLSIASTGRVWNYILAILAEK